MSMPEATIVSRLARVWLTGLLRWSLLSGLWAGLVWADGPSAPQFIVPDGCVVERVAGPPLVRYPLFACLDDQGRLYVAEGTGLNVPGTELVKKKLGRITLLEDTDGDGRFDKSTVFADRLVFPQGVLWHDGVVYTASHPNIWKLRDTDGDGRADRREVLAGTFGFNGNGCDIHGPFLGPDGYIYWTDGRHGYDIRCPDGRRLQGLASRIFRCRPDGTGIERVAGGAFDNPVELVFTPEGEIIGTMDQGPGDRLLHYVEGGVYPRMDHPSVNELIRTGPPLGSVSEFSAALPVALCGLERVRSDHFGRQLQGSLLSAQFNVHRLQQHVLKRDGATWRSEDLDFLVSFDHDVHLSDVLEDADGSLLMIDMGAWFNYGCPTSKIAKPEVLGAIYRIRCQRASRFEDPWGKRIGWSSLGPDELVRLLGDPRLKVQDKAIARLAQLGAGAVPALAKAVGASAGLEARRNALWALVRIDAPAARKALRNALGFKEPSLRQVALHGLALQRDAEAVPMLCQIVVSDQPPLRLKAAEALGRVGDAHAVPALLESLRKGVSDRFLEHALIYALIRINDRSATLAALGDSNPNVRRAGLIALDQMTSGELTREQVIPLLDTDDPDLQQAALEVIGRHQGWSEAIIGLARRWLASPHLSEDQRRSLAGVLIAFSTQENIQQLVAEAMATPQTAFQTRLLLLEVMARSRAAGFPKAWHQVLASALTDSNDRLAREAVATVRSRALTDFDGPLLTLSRDANRPVPLRVAALECLTERLGPLPDRAFELLLAQLTGEADPLLQASAGRALGTARLNDRQLLRLADAIAAAGSLTVPLLTPSFQRTRSAKVGQALVTALAKSPGAEALSPDDLDKLLKNFPAQVHAAARPLVAKLTARREQQAAYLAQVKLRLLRTKGDPDRGRHVFFSKKAACAGCHRIGHQGGSVGPELTRIGRLRSPIDLVEAVIFPSSTIALGYEPYVIATTEGRVLSGIIVRETSDAIYLRTAQLAELRIPRSHVQAMRRSNLSIMPEGLEKSLSSQELADLLEFLYSCR